MTKTPIPLREARALNQALAGAAAALDREIATSGAVGRVVGNVLSRTTARSPRRVAWLAIAAALLVAAGLGSLADLALVGPRATPNQEVVVLDPLVFGPTGLGQQ